MNKVLKRPMFNMGGRAGAMDSGIISGFAKPSYKICLLYTSPSPRDGLLSRMPSSA